MSGMGKPSTDGQTWIYKTGGAENWQAGATSGGSGGGETAASYVVLSATSSLSNERVLTAGSGISITDNGANNTVVISSLGSLVNQLITNEIPSGSNDGINKQFTLASTPIDSGSILFFINGIKQKLGIDNDYTATGSIININPSVSYASGSNIDATYTILSTSSGSSGSGADSEASYVVVSTTSSLPNERILTAGSGISIVDNGANNTIVISATGGSSGGSDVSASYIVVANTASLPNERALAAGSGISITDNGANNTIVISATGGGGSVDPNAGFILTSITASVPSGRRLSGSNGIMVTDGGAGNDIVVELSASAPIAYHGYSTGTLVLTSSNWTNMFNALGNFTEDFVSGITRSASTFTVSQAGLYCFRSYFGTAGSGIYIAFRLSGSNGTLLQQTAYNSTQGPGILYGLMNLTAGQTFKLQYAAKSTSNWVTSDPIGGPAPDQQNCRSGDISIYRIG